jgi:hypothetical protein
MHTPRLFSLLLAITIACGFASRSVALNAGDKRSFAEMERDLTHEGQNEIARAKYILNAEDAAKMKVLCVKFTKNARGDGYILMSDGMDDAKATIEVVYAKLKNVQAYDPRNVQYYRRVYCRLLS